jgi:hypothetical protein
LAARPSTNGRNCSTKDDDKLETRFFTSPFFLMPALVALSLPRFVRDCKPLPTAILDRTGSEEKPRMQVGSWHTIQ